MLPALLVGYGLIGPLWARLLMQHPRLVLCAIVDTSENALHRAASELRSAQLTLTTDIHDAVRVCAPAVIVDTSPPWSHADTARVARAARCHLLSEKPLSTDFRDAVLRIKEWDSSGLLYMVNQNYRWNPTARRLGRWIQQGGVGAVRGVYVDYYQDFPKGTFRDHLPHALILDMAVHHFDLARFITGLTPTSVACCEPSRLSAVATFQLTGGVVFSYRGSWDTIGGDSGRGGLWRIVGDRGSVTWSSQSPAVAVTLGDGSLDRLVLSVDEPTYSEEAALSYELAKSLDHFVECVLTGTEPETSCFDNLHTLRMVMAAVRAAEEQSLVRLNATQL